MKRSDRGWRLAGAALLAIGCVPGLLAGLDESGHDLAAADGATLLGAIVALAGLVLLAGGSRVVRALRIEAGPHRHLPLAIYQERRRRPRHHHRPRF